MVLCRIALSQTTSKEELVEAESKDKLEIVKQIKKVNDDGSYTIGYEADDGSFKIESRDVLGNIKGTYGFVDDDGEVKRVTYSTTNTTTETTPKPESSSVVQRIPRVNKSYSSSTRMPSNLSTPSVTPSTSATTVVQAIPRRKALPTAATTKTIEEEKTRVTPTAKSVEQIVRPEFATTAPSGRRLQPSKLLNPEEHSDIKPVTEQAEIHGNLLRRQTFDIQQHAANLRQTHGADAPDVYASSLTTGTPRPLFTTTARPIAGVPRFPAVYQRNPQEVTTAPPPESTTTQAPQYATPVPVPLAQIPPNQAGPLVAIRHPYKGTIIVPYSELQRREQEPNYRQVYVPYSEPEVQPDPRTVPVYVRRAPPQVLRSMPVQVDGNGYVREIRPIQQAYVPTSQYAEPDNDIESIKPPVSVQDFQKLLELLIIRQQRLEQVSRITAMRSGRYDSVYQATSQVPYRRQQDLQQRGPVQFSPQDEVKQEVAPQYRQVYYTPPQNYNPYQTYVPQQMGRRVARLLQPEVADNYLPPDVREMLLLRMLQLAINPALPLEPSDVEALESSNQLQTSRQPVRNVEILGEEDDDDKRMARVKRFFRST